MLKLKSVPMFFVLALGWAFMVWLFVSDFVRNVDIHNKAQIDSLNSTYRYIIKSHKLRSDLFFKNIVDTQLNREILAGAFESEDARSKARERLYEGISQEFNNLVESGFLNLTITDGKGVVLLRMREPQFHSDSLYEKRPYLKQALSSGVARYGYEVGSRYEGVTFCYPIKHGGRLIAGAVIVVPMSKVVETLSMEFDGEFAFLLKKTLANKLVEGGVTKFIPSRLDPEYLVDSSVVYNEFTKAADGEALRSGFRLSNQKESGVLHIDLSKEGAAMAYLRLESNSQGGAAYFLNYTKDQHYQHMRESLIVKLTLITVLFVLIALTVYRQKKLLNRLSDSERYYKSLFENAAIGFCNVSVEGRFMAVNSRLSSILGYTKEELLSLDFQSITYPDDLVADLDNVKQIFERKIDSYSMNKRYIKKNGDIVWARLTVGFAPDEMGGVKYFISTVEDISEQIKTAELLEFQRRQFRVVLESIPSMVFIKDRELKISYANSAAREFLGYPDEDGLIGKTTEELVPPEEAKRLVEEEREIIESLKSLEVETEITGAGEKKIKLLSYRAPFVMEDGSIGILGVSTDITKLKDEEELIKQQSQMLLSQSRYAAMGEMLSMIAHQWRQPITAIGMSVNNVLIDLDVGEIDNEELKRHLKLIEEQVGFLSQTIDDFRNFFRPSSALSRVSVRQIVNKAVAIMGKSLASNGIIGELDIRCDAAVSVHEGELVQVLLVFLSNAKDAIKERGISDGVIKVSVECEDKNSVQISVSDNGGGVDESVDGKIFEPYFTTKETKNGTGLGLYIAKTIIEKYQNGKIGVQNINGGASFWIKLQIDSDDRGES